MRRCLSVVAVVVVAAVSGVATAQSPTVSVARLVVTPAKPVMNAGDTLRLSAQAFDSAGRPVAGVRLRFQASGGQFEAEVDSTGLVRSGATGTIPVAVTAVVAGERPVVARVDVRIVPGPAARVEPSQTRLRLALGQEFRLTAKAFSISGD